MPAPMPSPHQRNFNTLPHMARVGSWIPGGPTWAAARVLAATLAVSAVGCAGEPAAARVEVGLADGVSTPSIFGGQKDDDAEALSGVVALRVGTGTTFELCSGALVAPNVVLTARHCVTRNVTATVSCDERGGSANGKHVISEVDPAIIGVYLGASPRFATAPVARARAIVAPTGPYLCDSDIALVVLDTEIADATPLAVRLQGPARTGEMIRAVGYGQNDLSSPIGTRFRRLGVPVLAQGAAVSASKTPLGAREFEVGVSICQGDSGGPAISEETGAVVGVVSRGGGCDEDFGHIYTTTSGFDEVFAEAFRLAGGAAPTREDGQVAPRTTSTRSTTAEALVTEGEAPGASAACAVAAGSSSRGPSGTFLAAVLAAVLGLRLRRRRAR